MSATWLQLLDPISRKPLRFTRIGSSDEFGYWAASESSQRWPVALGIPFLRVDRAELASAVVRLLIASERVDAVGLLLQDTDDFAPTVPSVSACCEIASRLLANDGELHGREMMEALCYGPVADYFALRGSAPTFFSGLGLIKLGMSRAQPLIEVGCGVGHFLYWLQSRGVDAVGTDSVFSKLCIANRFLNVKAERLICAVAGHETLMPMATTRACNVFCHDAFYFIKDKTRSLMDFRRLAGTGGTIMVGHCHLSTADHGKVSGYPLTLDAYRQLVSSDAHFFDDAALVAVGAETGMLIREISPTAEAIAFLEGTGQNNLLPWKICTDELLHAPYGVTWQHSEQRTHMHWPSAAFAEEYQAAEYLTTSQNPFEYLPARGCPAAKILHPALAVPTAFLALGAKPLRWGIIGGGWIAADYFVPAFEFTPLARLVSLAELNDERRAVFSEISGLQTFSDWREMLACCELDAVYIATPNDSHAEILEGVAAAGLRALCEKPIATNEGDLAKIKNCAALKPDFFQTSYDQRYHPAHVRLARRIAEGCIGTVTQIRIHYACWVDGAWSKVAATDNWRIDRSRAGGGAGFDLLPHCIDLLSMLTGEAITDANLLYQGRAHDYALGDRIDDGALMAVKTERGILASIHVGYNCPENQPRRRIEIIGTQGRVEAYDTMGQDPGGELIWQMPAGETRESFPTGAEAGPFVRQLDAVSRLWLRGDAPRFPFEHDLILGECLIRCDAQAKSQSIASRLPS